MTEKLFSPEIELLASAAANAVHGMFDICLPKGVKFDKFVELRVGVSIGDEMFYIGCTEENRTFHVTDVDGVQVPYPPEYRPLWDGVTDTVAAET